MGVLTEAGSIIGTLNAYGSLYTGSPFSFFITIVQ